MKNYKNLKRNELSQLVKIELTASNSAKECDKVLISRVLRHFADLKTTNVLNLLSMQKMGQIPSIQTITRAGRSLRAKHKELQGSNYQERKRKSRKVRICKVLENNSL